MREKYGRVMLFSMVHPHFWKNMIFPVQKKASNETELFMPKLMHSGNINNTQYMFIMTMRIEIVFCCLFCVFRQEFWLV